MSRQKRPNFEPDGQEDVVDDKDFLEILKEGIARVIRSDKSSPKEISDAVTAGAKLVTVKHKTQKGGDKRGYFD